MTFKWGPTPFITLRVQVRGDGGKSPRIGYFFFVLDADGPSSSTCGAVLQRVKALQLRSLIGFAEML